MLQLDSVCGEANREGDRGLEGTSRWLRVQGRGWMQRKGSCILAAGRDTAVERWGRDDCHGRSVKNKW
jgi:hypothetical protein